LRAIGGCLDHREVAYVPPEIPLDRDDVVSIMETLFDIRARVDDILFLLEEEGDGEEEE
jgi:hypothetical protein